MPPNGSQRLELFSLHSGTMLVWLLLVAAASISNHRLVAVLATTGCFVAARAVVGWIGVPKAVRDKKAGLYKNTMVAVLHAVIVGALTLRVIVAERASTFAVPLFQDVSPNPLIHGSSQECYRILCLTTGYFAYDLCDMLRSQMHHKAPHLVVHHVILLVCYMCGLHRELCVPFLVLTLLCELNSVALHMRILLKPFLRFQPSKLMNRTLWAYLWITFILTRTVGHAAVMIQVFVTTFELKWMWWMGSVGMAVFNLLNVDLLRSTYTAYTSECTQRYDVCKQEEASVSTEASANAA